MGHVGLVTAYGPTQLLHMLITPASAYGIAHLLARLSFCRVAQMCLRDPLPFPSRPGALS